MRISRVFLAAGLAMSVAVTSAAILSAQAKSEDDYDRLMKGVGAANALMRKATDPAAVGAEAAKLVAYFKDVQQFWTARDNKEAADWAASAGTHAAEIVKAAESKNADGIAAHQKELGGVCQACHAKNREKASYGFVIKKGN